MSASSGPPDGWGYGPHLSLASEDASLPSSVRDFHREQNQLAILMHRLVPAAPATPKLILASHTRPRQEPRPTLFGLPLPEYLGSPTQNVMLLSISANICLVVIKIIATILSGSLSVVSSVVDSCLDLFSGAVMFVTASYMRRRHKKFPVGKLRYESLAAIFIASVMGTAAVEVIVLAIQDILSLSTGPSLNAITLALLGTTIGVKCILFTICRIVPTPTAQTLALDHKNDVMSNCAALVGAVLGSAVWPYADPLGAILISLYIVVNWTRAGWLQAQLLAGKSAPPAVLNMVTWVAAMLHPQIVAVDTVRAYSLGTNYFAEVDLVFPRHMPLAEAHDIGASVQHALEHVEGIERAFVHLDVDSVHSVDEHRDVYRRTKDSSLPDSSLPPPCAPQPDAPQPERQGSVIFDV